MGVLWVVYSGAISISTEQRVCGSGPSFLGAHQRHKHTHIHTHVNLYNLLYKWCKHRTNKELRCICYKVARMSFILSIFFFLWWIPTSDDLPPPVVDGYELLRVTPILTHTHTSIQVIESFMGALWSFLVQQTYNILIQCNRPKFITNGKRINAFPNYFSISNKKNKYTRKIKSNNYYSQSFKSHAMIVVAM